MQLKSVVFAGTVGANEAGDGMGLDLKIDAAENFRGHKAALDADHLQERHCHPRVACHLARRLPVIETGQGQARWLPHTVMDQQCRRSAVGHLHHVIAVGPEMARRTRLPAPNLQATGSNAKVISTALPDGSVAASARANVRQGKSCGGEADRAHFFRCSARKAPSVT